MSKELTVLEKEVNPIIGRAETLKIVSNDDLEEAAEILTTLNQWNDKVVEDREKLTKPLNETLKEIRGRYKPLETVLEASIARVRSLMTKWATDVEKARVEAEQKLAGRIGDGKGKLKMETAVKKMSELTTVDKTVESEEGKVTFVDVQCFEVVDMAKLPLQFHLANEKEIRRLMLQGIQVEGVRYFTEKSLRNTR